MQLLLRSRGWIEADKGQIKTGYKEIFLQPKSGQRVEQSSGRSCECGVRKQL